ncbi:MAG: MFS transporter [Thermodesulfovibrionales bacterium]|nr:MFS transporter [Thermodesulfovibrionales bacterium]
MSAYRKKEVLSWCLYDFANSTYSAVIVAVIFPVYYTGYIVGNDAGLGDLWWGRAISLSMLFVALTSPVLGGIADFAGLRKRFLLGFTALCVTCVAMLGSLKAGMVIQGFVLITLANIGMEGAMVFYNSYLPDIASRQYQGRVSSWGFGIGYAGSMLSLIIALPLVKGGHYALTWLMVSAMFALFSIPAFRFLPPDRSKNLMADSASSISKGISHTFATLKELWKDSEAKKFLLGYLLYADGVNTVIVFSSVFAATTLGFATGELIVLYIVVQATALTGAFAMAKPTDLWGPKKVVMISLVMWSTVCVLAFFVTEKAHFWAVGTLAGLSLGTVQAASRAFFAQFIPKGHESEYFGVYTLAGKTSAILGPLVFGIVSTQFGSQRPAILSVIMFFAVGMCVIHFVRAGGPNVS